MNEAFMGAQRWEWPLLPSLIDNEGERGKGFVEEGVFELGCKGVGGGRGEREENGDSGRGNTNKIDMWH
jgi:hypothetical protein